jgi:small GTP-binding protein
MQPQDINLTTDLKIIIIGKSGAGKTSFVNKWIKNTFDETYKSTIVSEYSSKIIKYADKIYHINLWDIAGQDHNIIITRTFSKNAHGCITMADATEPISLQETIKWKKALDDSENFPDQGKVPNILIENKVDLIEGKDANDNSKLEEFAKENGFDGCFKTSAKTGLNINETINKLMSIIVTRLNSVAEKENDMNRQSLQVDPENHSEKDKYRTKQVGCC